MIVCSNCGFHNDDADRFCGGCQEYLDWTGEATEAEPDAQVDEVATTVGPDKGLVERVVDRLTGGPDDDTAPAGLPGSGTGPSGAVVPGAGADADARRPGDDLAREAIDRARERAETAGRREDEARRTAAAREEEAARAENEARAAEEDEAEAAWRAAREAEQAHQEAVATAREEARAAETARRAAALVARPRDASGTATADPGAPPGTPGPGPTPPTPGRRRARPRRRPSPEVEPDPPAEEPSGPGAVKPEAARRRRVSTGRPAVGERLRPGDRVCGNCGTGNAPDRNFCRRCGDDLADTPVHRVPWWKRPFVRAAVPPLPAGSRPSGPKASGRDAMKTARGARRGVLGSIGSVTRVAAMVVIAAAVLGVAAIPSLREDATERIGGLTTSIRRLVAPEFVPVTPVGVTSSSAMGDHPAEHAIDNSSNRWWAENADGDGEGERLIVEFAEPVGIAAFGITPGAADPDEFVAQPRPRRLHLVFSNGTTMDVDVVDDHEFQVFDVDDAVDVTTVEIQVDEVWPGQSGSDLAITGVEFRTIR